MSGRTLTAAAVGICILSGSAFAHEDDPKVLDREPRYEGPGYRAALRDDPPDFRSRNIDLMTWITLPEFGANVAAGNDCWGYVSPSGREYAIMGLSNSTAFVEVTDPGNAQFLMKLSGPNSSWRDIKTYQNYAYAVSEGGSGIQVFDLSDIDNGNVTLVRTVTSGGTTRSHNVAIDTTSGYLYRCGGGNHGLRVYSLSNPSNPQYVASWGSMYVHDAVVYTYTSGPYAGRQVAFCSSGLNGGTTRTGVEILDVTNKSNIFRISRATYTLAGYGHQAWMSPDLRYLYVDDELDEQNGGIDTSTKVIDITDLDNPHEVSSFSSGSPAIDHNLYVRNTLIFEANYRSGLRVFDATDPLNPVQIGFYDTYPGSNTANFNGMWSNYPYFPSGTIIGSDIERGLFVFRLANHPLSFYFPDGLPEDVDRAGESIRVEVIQNSPDAQMTGNPTLNYDVGFGFESVPMTLVSGSTYEADFPAVGCNTTISYYISADSGKGVLMTSPVAALDETEPMFHQTFAPGDRVLIGEDALETGIGWTVNLAGNDDATAGQWTNGDPSGTVAQTEDDHTPGGTNCWYTGPGAEDVDVGITRLTSAQLDMSVYTEPVFGYWRWYSNNTGDYAYSDKLKVHVSDDNGATYRVVEKVGPSGIEAEGGWYYNEFRISKYVQPNDQVRIRFVASDTGTDSTIEAAVDDIQFFDLQCASCTEDIDGNGIVDLGDLAQVLSQFGQTGAGLAGDIDGDNAVTVADLAMILATFGSFCS